MPFRRTVFRESSGACDLAQGGMVDAAGEEEYFEERTRFLVACLPDHSKSASCQAYVWESGKPALGASFPAPRWLKRVLLMSTFTAWTAAAIALAIALG